MNSFADSPHSELDASADTHEADVLLPQLEPSPGLLIDEDGRYTYSYGPNGFSGLLHNRFVLGCAVFASIGGLTFGRAQVDCE
jgi:hypothetical protein